MTLRRTPLRLAVLAAVTTAVTTAGVLAAAGAAQADEPLPGLKAAVTARIDLRLAALTKDTAVLAAAKNVTNADRGTLTALISQDTTGLTALKTKVQGETTAAAVKADATSMVDDYRIFILVGPKVRLASAGDAEQVALGKLQSAHDKLAGLVAKAKAGGTDTSSAEADLAAMQTAIDQAGTASNGQVGTLLAIQPGPDGTAIAAKVTGVRKALESTRTDLKTALADGKKVSAFLKSLPH
jgi:hypothetical protein